MFELLEIQKFNWEFFFFLCRCSDEARYFSPCMALLLNVVTHK